MSIDNVVTYIINFGVKKTPRTYYKGELKQEG